MRDEDHIGPINGHNKSEALPNGCAIVFVVAFGLMMALSAYGWIASGYR